MGQQNQIRADLVVCLPSFLKIDFTIQGFPEDVQRVADTLDAELAGDIEWTSFAETNTNNLIKLHGVGEYDPIACPISRIAVFDCLNVRCYPEIIDDFNLASSLSAFYHLTTAEL